MAKTYQVFDSKRWQVTRCEELAYMGTFETLDEAKEYVLNHLHLFEGPAIIEGEDDA